MEDLVRLDIVLTKDEAQHLLNVIAVGMELGEDLAPTSEEQAIDDIHTELWEALEPGTHGFQNRLVISPAAFPLYKPGK